MRNAGGLKRRCRWAGSAGLVSVASTSFGLSFLCAVVVAAAASATPPNVVLIFTDDQGYGDLGCFGSAAARVRPSKAANGCPV